MAARYEFVAEPETMEIIEDGVYHPDVTIASSTADSFRTLEPVVAGPIDLKTLFYSPRWSGTQKRFCLGFASLISVSCLILLICLIVGLAKTIGHIDEEEKRKNSGIFVVPNLGDYDLFIYNLPNKSEKHKVLIGSYILQIDNFLAAYSNQSSAYINCGANEKPGVGKLCKFDLNWLGTNCTKENHYGYYTGSPCLLFGMKGLKKWVPDISMTFLHSAAVTDKVSSDRLPNLDIFHSPVACFTVVSAFDLFDKPAKIENEFFGYYPDAGFHNAFMQNAPEIYTKPAIPLVFVQLNNLHKIGRLHIKCSVLAANIDRLEGVQSVTFEYTNSSADESLFLDTA